jgi:acyl-CoA reductase-like NAD-dependent aldehyde dehydrogenase
MADVQLFINGEFTDAVSGETFSSTDPATGQEWARVAKGGREDAIRAIEAARKAFDEGPWPRMSGKERAEKLNQIAEGIGKAQQQIAENEVHDGGGTMRKAMLADVPGAQATFQWFAQCAETVPDITELEGSPFPPSENYVRREPFGVTTGVIPWNFPLLMAGWKIAPSIAAGNCCVIKPASFTSVTALDLARVIQESDLPPGVVNVVAGGPSTGEALVGHPDVNKVSFTGSVGTGVRVAQLAAQSIVPVTLELGGKSANIVFPDANLERAIPGVVAGIYAAAGQTCVAGSRLLVHRSIHDEVVQALADRARALVLGDPLDDRTQMGPIAHRAQLDKTLDHIAWAHADGAELVAGGTRPGGDGPGLFVAPTLFVGVSNDTRLAQEEVFGPVLAVLSFGDEDEAIAIANATRFGLAAGVWTESLSRAHRVGRRLRCGTVWVNTYRRSATQAPFGGVKQSGYGRERGTEALRDYTTVKNTMIDLSENRRDEFTLTT